MTPGQIIRDVALAVVVIAACFVGWMLYKAGEDHDLKDTVKAIKQRVEDNAATEKSWRDQRDAADLTRDASLNQLHADMGKHAAPVIVRIPADKTGRLPANSDQAGGNDSHGSGTITGCRSPGEETRSIDIRPDLDTLKLKYGTDLIFCQSVLDQWPKKP